MCGRDVVEAARAAFPEAPEEFPAHLAVQDRASDADDRESDPNRALAALEDAAKSTGSWISGTAHRWRGVAVGADVVGSGVASAAALFRSVDIDGDGIPDEPQALTAVKALGGALAGAADAAGGRVAGMFKLKKRGTTEVPEKASEEDQSGSSGSAPES